MIEMREENPRRKKLLDDENRNKLPKLYSNEEQGLDAKVLVKFFTPDSNWTWYASEYDGKDIFFGLVSGHEVELGYFSLSELEQVRGPLGLEIERDLHFEAQTLKELLAFHRADHPPVQNVLAEVAARRLIDKLELFSNQLSKWDRRITEITTLRNLVNSNLSSETVIPLICTFIPEPTDDSQGFFSIVNLMARDHYEKIEERLGLKGLIDLGFKLNEKIYLPHGKILNTAEEQIILWTRNEQ